MFACWQTGGSVEGEQLGAAGGALGGLRRRRSNRHDNVQLAGGRCRRGGAQKKDERKAGEMSWGEKKLRAGVSQ